MAKHIPELIDPVKFAAHGEILSGEFEFARLPRLAASLSDSTSGGVAFDLKFFRDGNENRASGQYSTQVKMYCQRCLNEMGLSLTGPIQLVFVKGESQESNKDEEFETVIVSDEPVSLSELIEDEVILALPFAPMHEVDDCPASDVVKELQETNRPNPFAALAKLKDKQES